MVDLDQLTVAQAARGNEKAFKRLYDHYAPFVWRIVYRTAGGDWQAAEEIVQETFVRISRSLKQFSSASSLGTWIYRIAFNTTGSWMAKRLRQRSAMVPFRDDLPVKEAPFDAVEARDLVDKILAALPADDRFLLVAKEIDELRFDEIAAITGKSPESLRTQMSRLKEHIRNGFGREPVPEETIV